MSEVYGAKIEAQRRLTYLDLGAFTANTTVVPAARFGCPPGVRGVRIIGIHLLGDAIPSDPDGVLLVNALVNDVSEGGDDAIVASEDLETLMAAANRFYEATLAAETAEKQNTLEAGDSLRFSLVSDSAAITTNPNVTAVVEWHPVPDYDDLDRVQHPSDYVA
jgi:hypothetical protein